MSAVDLPTTVVLDASVAVRWVVPERGSDAAAALLEAPRSWISPRLLMTEVASALRRKVAGREVTAPVAMGALTAIVDAVRDGVIRLADDEDLAGGALALALALERTLPDCMYLALAEREGAALATADKALALMARRRGVAVLTVPSA